METGPLAAGQGHMLRHIIHITLSGREIRSFLWPMCYKLWPQSHMVLTSALCNSTHSTPCILLLALYYIHTEMKDLPYVRAALINVSAEWYNIGVHFRIHVNILDQIKRKNRSDCDRCLTAMIAEWLKSSPTQVDSPTWKKVVAAIASRVGGDNPSEARKIAKDYSRM